MADTSHKSGAAADFEAQIRAASRPVLSPEERKKAGNAASALHAQWAAAKAREAAAAQMKQAEQYESQAAAFQKGA